MVQKITLPPFLAKHFDVFLSSADFLQAAVFHVCFGYSEEYFNAIVLLT